jgi:hypothetical protein
MPEVIPQDELEQMLKTRGFADGFQATPLRDFWGELESFTGEMREPKSGGNPYLVVIYNFKNIEVIRSEEPYTSPVAQLEIPHSNSKKSKSGYWGASIDAIINATVPPDVPVEDPQVKSQSFLIGKMGHYKLMPGNPIPQKDQATGKFVDVLQDCWKLVELRDAGTVMQPAAGAAPAVPGAVPPPAANPVAATSPRDRALELLNGKTEQEWHNIVFVDPTVKADTNLVNEIVGRTFLTPYIAAGIAVLDKGTQRYTITQPTA